MRNDRVVLLLACLVFVGTHFSVNVSAADDGANACFDYRNLTDWMRSSGYTNDWEWDDWVHQDICDRQLEEGWYRAVTAAGGDMPQSDPGFHRCGTVYPAWLDGDLPREDGENPIDAVVCVEGVFSACDTRIDIMIKNCSDFNVYYLKPTKACPEAYCFGKEVKCLPGQPSPTGFTPGCDETGRLPPELTATPTLGYILRPYLSPRNATIHEIIFQCSIETPDIDEEIWFDVAFKIGDQVVYRIPSIHESDLPAELPEGKFADFQDDDNQPNLGYGNDLTCNVKGKWNETSDTGRSVEVHEHYGFEILTELPIVLEEGGEGGVIEVRSRLPMKGSDGSPDNPPEGGFRSHKIYLFTPNYHDDFEQCATDNQDHLLALSQTNCFIEVKEENWDTGASIAVKAEIQVQNGKDIRSLNAKFYSEVIPYRLSLSNLELPPVRITVVEKKVDELNLRCEVRCDPHMFLFDGVGWSLPKTDLFILYQNKKYDTEVQIATEKCASSQTCVCAVMVRSGLSVYVLDSCGDRSISADVSVKQPPRSKMYDCHEGRNDMIVEQITDKYYKFTLSTKTVVEVKFLSYNYYNNLFHNVYITPSIEDYEHATGLCGYIDQKGKVDKRLRTGQITNDFGKFGEEWKAMANESLWLGKSTSLGDPILYCGCSEDNGNEVVCEDPTEYWDCFDKIFNGKAHDACRVNKEMMRQQLLTGKRPRSSGIVDDDRDVIIDFEPEDFIPEEPEWSNGWTEALALEFCRDFIAGRQSVAACADVPNVDIQASIDLCVLDIFLTGNTLASDTHVDATKGRCLAVANRNLTMWKSTGDRNGTVVPPADIIEAGCLNECYDRGSCEKGVCTCYEGFSGVDCGTNDTAVPDIYKLPYSGVCDLQAWSCEATLVYGNDLFNTPNLTCRIQHFEVHAGGLVETVTEEVGGYMERPGAAACNLGPLQSINEFEKDDEVLGFAHGIQISNDGNNFGNKLTMLSYDSKCANCSNVAYNDVSCVALERVCKIEGTCFDDGEEMDASRDCMKCRFDTDEYDWTLEAGTCFIENQCFNDAEENPSEKCFICDVSNSTTKWTPKAGTCFIENQCFNDAEENPSEKCFICDVSNSITDWTPKAGTCFIENQCYNDGEANPNMNCFICDVSNSTSMWSRKAGTCFIENQCYGNGDEKDSEPCFTCDADSSANDWTMKAGTCFIENQCYGNGDEKDSEPCFTCDSDTSTGDWTMKEKTCFIDNLCYTDDDTHPSAPCMTCHSDSTTSDWTLTDDNSCFIDARCYDNLTPNPSQSCVSCQVQTSQYEWTLNDDRMCYIDDRCYSDMEGSDNYPCLYCVPQNDNRNWTIQGCLINQTCWGPEEVNPNNNCQQCSPADSQTEWTPIAGCFWLPRDVYMRLMEQQMNAGAARFPSAFALLLASVMARLFLA